MDSSVEMIDIGEGLRGEEVTFQIAPGSLDVVEFRGVFRQPFDGQPIPRGKAAREALLVWMGPLSSTKTTGLSGRPGHGPQIASRRPRRVMNHRCAWWRWY